VVCLARFFDPLGVAVIVVCSDVVFKENMLVAVFFAFIRWVRGGDIRA